MFQRLDAQGAPLAFAFEGMPVAAQDGDSVAAALLAAGIVDFRTTPSGASPRGPYCLMGACFDCLVEIDGAPNRQACQVPVVAGMQVRRMRGSRSA